MLKVMAGLPDGTYRLDTESARALPRAPSLYSAWIDGEHALADAGLAGDVRALWYVGIATGAHGLRGRLRDHARRCGDNGVCPVLERVLTSI